MKQQAELQESLLTHLLADADQGYAWHDIQLIAEPILHVLPETEEIPIALVGIAAIFTQTGDVNGNEQAPQTQAGTAVFYFQNDAWQTNGKVLLNLTPAEALNQLSLKAMVF